MKRIKVFLQFPWKFSDSPYYKYLTEFPPKEVQYTSNVKRLGIVISKRKFLLLNNLKKAIRLTLQNFSVPNAHFTFTKQSYDLIHCAHCLSLNKRPWVADFEGAWQFWIGKPNKLSIAVVRKILLSEYCKKIIPWTYAVRKHILNYFPGIEKKVEVVYPAVPLSKVRREKEEITIIYVARHFWIKGGLVALETLKKLKKKYDIRTTFISDVPNEIRKRYLGIDFFELMPYKKLVDYYRKASIFIYPSFIDTFGFALLEAMSFGLPIVTVNTMWTSSRKEMIEDGKQGFVIDVKKLPNYYKIRSYEEKIIKKMVEKISKIIENSSLRKKMSKNCIEVIRNGKFSIKERNKKLRKIYEEALK